MKRGLNTHAKRIDSGQPAQSAQADLGRNVLKLTNILHVKEQDCPIMQSFFFEMHGF